MTHSLIGADARTHCRIVAVALLAAAAFVMVGLSARAPETDTATAWLRAEGQVLKAGKPLTFTTRDATTIR